MLRSALAALTLLSFSLASSSTPDPLPLREVVVQGGATIQATGPSSFRLTDLGTVPFEYAITTGAPAGTPITEVTLLAPRIAFTHTELAHVDRQLGNIARQCLGASAADVAALSAWLREANSRSVAGVTALGPLEAEIGMELDLDSFETFTWISLRRTQGGWPGRCVNVVPSGPSDTNSD